MLNTVLVGVLIFVSFVVVIGVYLLQEEKARCPRCGSIYFEPVEGEKSVRQCRQCPYKGPWDTLDPLAGEEKNDGD